jgi:hypothetical protein
VESVHTEVRHKRSVEGLYFESGSSTAYAAYALLEYTKNNAGYWQNECRMKEKLKIITNNFFTLLDFTTYRQITKPIKSIALYPQGPFSEDYGATYGPIGYLRPDDNRMFLEDGWKLSARARKACEEVTKEVDKLLGNRGLIIMAVSGIDWSDRHIRGPHAGSYHNMLMKRSLLHSKHAKIIILDEIKWKNVFNDDRCFPLCGDGTQWSDELKSKPIAFAIGVERECNAIVEKMREIDFDNIRIKHGEKVVDIIAYNDVFKQWLDKAEPVQLETDPADF